MIFYTEKIFTSSQLKILRKSDGNTFQKRLSYNLKNGNLCSIKKGIYMLPGSEEMLSHEDILLLSNKFYSPSYISFETVLQSEGIIFQYDSNIKVACNYNKTIHIDIIQSDFDFFRLPKEMLTEPIGIQSIKGYSIATKERAFCDTIYRSKNFYFDDLSSLDREIIRKISNIFVNYNKNFLDIVLKYKEQICENKPIKQ